MKKLNLKFDGDFGIPGPCVGVVQKTKPETVSQESAISLTPTSISNIFEANGRQISFDIGDLSIGEILLIFPREKTAARFYRPLEKSNTILLTEQCDQLCIMCSQPPKNSDFTYWELYKQACCELPTGLTIGISGGEPTLFKDGLFEFLEDMRVKRPDLRFHILTNAQHFEENDLQALQRLNEFVVWGIPIYAHERELHDNIVGKNGAFDRLFESFLFLLQSEARVELRTVVLQQNLHSLPFLAKQIAKYFQWVEVWSIMQLERIGFARIDWPTKFEDTSEFFDFVADALLISKACGINAQLYNFPHCTVPSMYRGYCVDSISDWKKKFLVECEKCSARNVCCGFFEWYNEEDGFKRINRL